MTRSPEIADLKQRRHALDPSRSFIVQAPAGSGKTELLIQRYLVLLSRVESPEEIAAVTFTLKAASEMKKRVLDALASARTGNMPREPHRLLTWEQAQAALARDNALGWWLEQNAARLRIQTIDALCASLARQMPLLAAFGAAPRSVEDAAHLYREAARATLGLIDGKEEAAEDVARILAHLDNDFGAAEDLLAGMLGRRDHWLRNLGGAHDRGALEAALAAARLDALERLRALVPAGLAAEIGALASYAADRLADAGRDSPVRECADLDAPPAANEAGMFAWLGIAELLVTAAGEWRRTADARIGFPAGEGKSGKAIARHWKERHAALIERAAEIDALREALDALRRLPPAQYTDTQWEALGAIARLLPIAVAELKLVFAARGEADFVEIAQGALAALGEADAPTDLLLSLDYRIHHILVDEFQDTSFTQFDLLHKLTAGWTPGDGRTLFLVGDPMQSIYRFREAEVGLFLKARSQGIGEVALEPLALSANFRSQAGLVDWVNRAFERVMPPGEDAASGAVPYCRCEPVHPARRDAVQVHAFFNGDGLGEALRVRALVEAARVENPEGSVAVLVRNRSHLERIIPVLKEHGLPLRAIEIEALGHRQVVQDLFALTRALEHPADRIAWLALLRAPWCGLALTDLHALASVDCPTGAAVDRGQLPEEPHQAGISGQLTLFVNEPEMAVAPLTRGRKIRSGVGRARTGGIIWELLHDESRLARLSADARQRILGDGAGRSGIRTILTQALANRQRGSLRDRVEGVWLALGGPACVQSDTDLEDAGIYLDYLEKSEVAGAIPDTAAFEDGLAGLYALPDLHADPQSAVQIMTIHKAKGLEFDTVIIPGLGRIPRKRDPSLFLWMERPVPVRPPAPTAESQRSNAGPPSRREREPALLLAPIRQAGAGADPIYEYLVRLDAEKEDHEEGRLLYVAATRAKLRLHLLGDVRLDTTGDDLKPGLPGSGSLLAKMWPLVSGDFAEAARATLVRRDAAGVGEETAVAALVATGEERAGPEIDQSLRRLPGDWEFPAAPAAVAWAPPGDTARAREEIEFSWVGETARHVGSVVHRWLQRIAEDELKGWSRARVDKMRAAFRDELAARGVGAAELASAAGRVAKALASTLDDPRGRWLLGPQKESRSEYRISAVIGGERRDLVVDRLFVDAEGTRWIVDYKSGGHEGAGVDAFLDTERTRYAAQLELYARCLGRGGPVKLGLYFPLISGWRDWRYVS